MKAAWDWDLPRETPAEERALVEFAADLGFDTLIVHDPTGRMVDRGHEHGLEVIAIVTPEPTAEFRDEHPEALQAMLPAEERAAAVLEEETPGNYRDLTHRPFTPYRRGDWVCSRHPAAESFLADRVEEALAVADGVALDGFGYRNQYACFCDRCRDRRATLGGSDDPEPAVLTRDAEATLVEVHDHLYEHAKAVAPDATVTNHVWPPFRPNPRIGDRYRLDYCSQTIAWFYPPHPDVERVAFEAREHARRERPSRNTFVPFVGLYADPYKRRSADRVRRELEIGLEHGDGHLVFCTLGGPDADPAIADALRDALA